MHICVYVVSSNKKAHDLANHYCTAISSHFPATDEGLTPNPVLLAINNQHFSRTLDNLYDYRGFVITCNRFHNVLFSCMYP